jgi:aquaporin NIP
MRSNDCSARIGSHLS